MKQTYCQPKRQRRSQRAADVEAAALFPVISAPAGGADDGIDELLAAIEAVLLDQPTA